MSIEVKIDALPPGVWPPARILVSSFAAATKPPNHFPVNCLEAKAIIDGTFPGTNCEVYFLPRRWWLRGANDRLLCWLFGDRWRNFPAFRSSSH
jgi:hypothetical protein